MRRAPAISRPRTARAGGAGPAAGGRCGWRAPLTLVWALLVLPGASAQAQSEAMVRIGQMIEAARSLNYDARFVYSHDGMMDEMRIIHRFGPGGERERLITLNGAAREVLRDDTRVTCIIPDSESVVVGKSRPQAVYGSAVLTAAGYADSYTLRLGSATRVAGRLADQITIEPHDQYRYGYRLWVDRETSLLLRSELVSEHGKVLESIVYTSLDLPSSISDELLRPAISGNGFSWYTTGREQSAPARSTRWYSAWLPPGFSMRDRETSPPPGGRSHKVHLVYGDGLASVSVYIERIDDRAPVLEGVSRMGAMSAFGAVVRGHQVTVVGEVPAGTVRAVGESVALRD